jgi:polysaccharide export outer membrane protein
MKISAGLASVLVIAQATVAAAQSPRPPAATAAFPQASASPPTAPAAVPAPPPAAAAAPVDYVIGPGDVLSVSVWKNEALSRVVPVRPDGKISLPLLQDIHAAGLTAMQLRDKIANALVEFLPSPEVAVTLTEINSFRVSVLGEVAKPGVYQFRSAATVLEAIALAGGLGRYATGNKIAIIRRDSNGATQKFSFNYNRAVTTTSDQENFLLQPGDVIVVP